jgi:transcriptional regulator with XRE-family HTH domain
MPHHTINTRWFNAVLQERGMSQRELCRRLGLDSSAMSLTFRGKRQMKMTEAVDIARLLGVPLTDVMANAGIKLDSTGMRMAPVVGYVDGEGEAHIDWRARGGERVSVPAELPEDTVALVTRSIGGPFALMDGWTFFLEPPAPPSSDIVGRYSVVGLQDGIALLRFVRRGYKPGLFNLASETSVSIENAKLEWASPVLLIRP